MAKMRCPYCGRRDDRPETHLESGRCRGAQPDAELERLRRTYGAALRRTYGAAVPE